MSKPLDRLTLLETFARISDRGSISGAARDLGLSQASASRQLKELEDRLGVQLVRRTTHSLALTLAGQELLRDARALLADWGALEDRHGVSHGLARGPLKVVAPIALGQRYLVDLALDFQAEYPDVSLTWRLDDDPIRFAEVGCDCWIKVGPVPDESLIVREMGTVERLLVCSADLAAGYQHERPRDLAGLPFAALEPFEGDRIALGNRRNQRAEIKPSVRFTTNNIFALYRAALRGIGAAILPEWFVADDLAAGRLVNLLPQWQAAALPINAAFLPARHQPKRLTRFLESLEEGVREIPGIAPAPTA